MDQSIPWGYFDGSTQGEPQMCGSGIILNVSASPSFNSKASVGEGTKIFAKLMDLKLLLLAAIEKNCTNL